MAIQKDHLPAGPEDNSGGQQSQDDQQATTHNVTFTVTNATNQKLSGVTVTLTDINDSTNTASDITDSDGSVSIAVKAGTYSVTAERDTYTAPANIENVTVTNADVDVATAIVMTKD